MASLHFISYSNKYLCFLTTYLRFFNMYVYERPIFSERHKSFLIILIISHNHITLFPKPNVDEASVLFKLESVF